MSRLMEYIKQREEELAAIKAPWSPILRDVNTYITPNRGMFSKGANGDIPFEDILDTTGVWANVVLASAVEQFLTDRASRWFFMETEDPSKMDDEEIRKEVQKQEDIAYNLAFNNPATQFLTSSHEMYLDLCSYGTGVMLIEDLPTHPITYRAFNIRNCDIDENFKGEIDTNYRYYQRTARQLKQEFSESGVSAEISKAATDQPGRKYECIHAVGPDDQKFFRSKGFTHYSVQYVKGENKPLKTGGYKEFPYVIPRWLKSPEEIYGRGPGINAVPTLKLTNAIIEVIIKGGQLRIAPPLDLPFESYMMPMNMDPFGLNFRMNGGAERAEPLFTGGDPGFGYEFLQPFIDQITRLFFIDQLRLAEKTPQMTATEVVKRNEDQMRVMGPQVSRIQSESNTKLLKRTYNILRSRGEIDSKNNILAGQGLKIRYTSPVSRAQKATQTQAFSRMIEAVAPLMEIQPDVLDKLDTDEAIKWFSKIYDVPVQLIRSDDQVKSIRDARAKSKQAEQDGINTANAASATKDFAEAGQITRSGI